MRRSRQVKNQCPFVRRPPSRGTRLLAKRGKDKVHHLFNGGELCAVGRAYGGTVVPNVIVYSFHCGEVHTASFRSVRGYTVVAAILDEIAFWRSEDSANPDREIVNALRPAMATVPGALLLAMSSPYARRGVVWDAYQRH